MVDCKTRNSAYVNDPQILSWNQPVLKVMRVNLLVEETMGAFVRV